MGRKLELTWPGKEQHPRLEPRILIEKKHKRYPEKPNGSGIANNILIKGDNLLALRALSNEFEGSVQAIYIDPPFNTGEALIIMKMDWNTLFGLT